MKKGGSLTPDQEKAVAEYDSVCQLIDSLRETSEIIAEIQEKVSRVVRDNEACAVVLREKYAIDVFRKICPILDLLSKIQVPAVKSAIIKASSLQKFRFLENASRILNVRLPSGFKVEDLDTCDLFKQPSEYMFNLANGVQIPINKKNGKSRSVTFAELRQICFDLLVNDDVRCALAVPLSDIHKNKPTVEPSPTDRNIKARAEPVINAESARISEKSIPSNDALPVDAILNSVIKPLKTTFNFLQVSSYLNLDFSVLFLSVYPHWFCFFSYTGFSSWIGFSNAFKCRTFSYISIFAVC